MIAADANNHEGIVGIAPDVRILALKACWQLQSHADGAQCNSFTLAQAPTIAIDSGARVINLSLGGPADPLLTQLVNYAHRPTARSSTIQALLSHSIVSSGSDGVAAINI